MRVCVFTAIFSEKEPIDKPGKFQKIDDWDYIMYTNLDPSCFGSECPWTVKQVDVPRECIPKEPAVGVWIYANRYYKWMPQQHLPEYDVVIYVDGFQAPNPAFSKLWMRLATDVFDHNVPFSVVQSPHANSCIYKELNAIVIARKDTRARMDNILTFLNSVGYPRNYGLYWNGCYVVNNRCKRIKKVWSDLWSDMIKFTYRDQALMMYELWKNNEESLVYAHDLYSMVSHVYNDAKHRYV